MPRFLALEWSDNEARLAVASLHGEGVIVEHAFSVELTGGVRPPPPPPLPGAPAGVEASQSGEFIVVVPPAEVGKQVADALAARGIRRIDTLVAIGRASIELRQLTFPPAPDDELPEMVRFQALREFNALQEDWPLDFIPLDENPAEPRNVLAAAIAPELVEQIQGTCQAAGVRLRRLTLRPCGAASLFCRRQAGGGSRARLLVDLVADDADLTVMIDRKVIFLRTARLPGDPLVDDTSAQALLGEIRRTMAAVHNQLGGRRVESIVLCGSGPQHATLGQLLADRLDTPAEVFDPFEGLELGEGLQRGLPEHPGRFTPLLGMLVDELHQAHHAIDFLHPRQKPKPPSPIKQYVLAALGAVALVALLFVYRTIRIEQLTSEAAQLAADVKKAEAKAGETTSDQKAAADILAWQAGDPVWLDEIRWLSERLPPAEEAMLTQFQASVTAKRGEMRLEGLARSVDTLKAAEAKLRDPKHRLLGKETAENTSHKGYSLRFNSSVYLVPEARR